MRARGRICISKETGTSDRCVGKGTGKLRELPLQVKARSLSWPQSWQRKRRKLRLRRRRWGEAGSWRHGGCSRSRRRKHPMRQRRFARAARHGKGGVCKRKARQMFQTTSLAGWILQENEGMEDHSSPRLRSPASYPSLCSQGLDPRVIDNEAATAIKAAALSYVGR